MPEPDKGVRPFKIEVPGESKYVLVVEYPDKSIMVEHEGFIDEDQMMGFIARVCNPQTLLQVIGQAKMQMQQTRLKELG